MIRLDWCALTAERDLVTRAAYFRSASRQAGREGWTHWAAELITMSRLAYRAARAEKMDPPPSPAGCGICGGARVCDLLAHRLREAR